MSDTVLGLLQVIAGAILGTLGTLALQKITRRDEQKDKIQEDHKTLRDNYRSAFISELSALQVSSENTFPKKRPRDIVAPALEKQRIAVIELKRHLPSSAAQKLELAWSSYAKKFTDRLVYTGDSQREHLNARDIAREIEQLLVFGDLPLNK